VKLAGFSSAAFLMLCCVIPVQADDTLQVSDPWIREAPPGATVLAGYLTLTNTTSTPLVIEAVSSPAFEAVEIHRSQVVDGVAHMQPVSELTVPATGSISLAPGGYHLMLLRPVRALTEGDNVTLLLHRADGICVTVTAPVLRMTESSSHQH
jgi:copper(I)-binding protein